VDQLHVGIVGAAGRGASFFSSFTENAHTRITALCDLNAEGLARAAALVGEVKTYTDYEQMLDDAGLDLVMIGTPMPLHVPQSIAALRRDLHVLCEVPAAVNLDEARELVQAANRSRGKYMMAENYCYIRSNVIVREMVRAGLFGEVYFGEGEYLHELKGLNEITKWRRKWQTGINGATYPTHSFGPVYQWMNQRAVAVSCTGSGHHYEDPRGDAYENEDSITLLCRMEHGGLVNVRVDMLSNRPHCMAYYSLQGTKGCYEAPRAEPWEATRVWLADRCSDPNEWRPLSDFEEEFSPARYRRLSAAAFASGHWGADHLVVLEFVEAVREGRDPDVGIHQAMDMTLPGLVSQQSIAQGGAWLPVPDSRTW